MLMAAEADDEGDKDDATCLRARMESLLMLKVVWRVLVLADRPWYVMGDAVQAGWFSMGTGKPEGHSRKACWYGRMSRYALAFLHGRWCGSRAHLFGLCRTYPRKSSPPSQTVWMIETTKRRPPSTKLACKWLTSIGPSQTLVTFGQRAELFAVQE